MSEGIGEQGLDGLWEKGGRGGRGWKGSCVCVQTKKILEQGSWMRNDGAEEGGAVFGTLF